MDLPIVAEPGSLAPAPVAAERGGSLRIWTVLVAYFAVALASVATTVVLLAVELAQQLARNPALRGDAGAVAEIARQFIRSDRFLLVALASTSFILAAVALAAGRLSPEPIGTRLALRRSPITLGTLAVAVLGCAALSSTFDAGFAALGRELTGSLGRLGALITGQTPRGFIIVLFLGGVAAPVSEELFFRGYVQTRLCRRWGSWPGIIASAALFGLLHLDWVQSPSAFLIGVFLGWLAERAGSTLPAMVAHASNNVVWMLGTFLGLGVALPRFFQAALLVVYVFVTAAAVTWMRRRFPAPSTAERAPPSRLGQRMADGSAPAPPP